MTNEERSTPEHKSVGRRLYGDVTLWQDWGEEAADSEVKYWELFTDLLMVAAASSLADGLVENQNWTGFLEFVALYSAIVHGWLLYTHHFTSRFLEGSLLHSGILFFYLLGMALTIVHASVETARGFSLGVVLQRIAFLAMMTQVAVSLPRARTFAATLMIPASVSVVLFLTTGLFTFDNHSVTRTIWLTVAGLDMCTELGFVLCVSKQKLVPVNIEHSKDRLGVLVLVMMGETVISASVAYREYMQEGLGEKATFGLYILMVFSFLLVFMFTLIYFHMQPHPDDHAFRRSRSAGLTALALHKVLGMTLLLVGVCIKLAVKAVAEGEELEHHFSRSLLNFAVGSSMMTLFGLRCTHYLGKLPNESHVGNIRLLMNIWWCIFSICSICPFFFPLWDGRPIPQVIVCSIWLLILCVTESSFTHILERHLLPAPHHGESTERTHLQDDAAPSYNSGEA